jgi:hypothetical protein
MGTLHPFPEISSTRRNPHFRDLSQTNSNFVRQLKSLHKLADESVQKLAEAPLSVVIERLETALADVGAIGRLLPSGEFKTQFELDRSSLSKQLDLVKGKIIGLWEQADLVWEPTDLDELALL